MSCDNTSSCHASLVPLFDNIYTNTTRRRFERLFPGRGKRQTRKLNKFYCRWSIFGWHLQEKKRRQTGDGESDFRHNFPCIRCPKRFTMKKNLNRHMRIHTGNFNYYCDVCEKGFAQKGRYTDHIRGHKGLRYYCEHCGKAFTSNEQYRHHLLSHPAD